MWPRKMGIARSTIQISTHTSRVGCDGGNRPDSTGIIGFLLTHPVWDVTDYAQRYVDLGFHFYSHIPCGMWRCNSLGVSVSIPISTHTSRVGCDGDQDVEIGVCWHFYSHIPCGMWHKLGKQFDRRINFYSHIPCGMWRGNSCTWSTFQKFLLTHPVWDVTFCDNKNIRRAEFLLTHPVWDVTQENAQINGCYQFLLTHPVWDVTTLCPLLRNSTIFLLTHPVWDVTCFIALLIAYIHISTHTSRVGCDES